VNADSHNGESRVVYFRKCFDIPGQPAGGDISVAADGGANVFVDGAWVAWLDGPHSADTLDLGPYLHGGWNCIEIKGENESCPPCRYRDAPAGVLFRGHLDYTP
jgi:hypothetical protein